MKFSSKNEVVLIAVVLTGAFLFVFSPALDERVEKTANAASVTIKEIVIPVELAVTDEEKMLGLGGWDALPEDEGMLFVFDEARRHIFWMKDMLFDLDILWIATDGRIVDIEKNATPESFPNVFIPAEEALYVLEVNAGFADAHGIETGDFVNLSL